MKSSDQLRERMIQLAGRRKQLIEIRQKLVDALSATDNNLIDNQNHIKAVAQAIGSALAREAAANTEKPANGS